MLPTVASVQRQQDTQKLLGNVLTDDSSPDNGVWQSLTPSDFSLCQHHCQHRLGKSNFLSLDLQVKDSLCDKSANVNVIRRCRCERQIYVTIHYTSSLVEKAAFLCVARHWQTGRLFMSISITERQATKRLYLYHTTLKAQIKHYTNTDWICVWLSLWCLLVCSNSTCSCWHTFQPDEIPNAVWCEHTDRQTETRNWDKWVCKQAVWCLYLIIGVELCPVSALKCVGALKQRMHNNVSLASVKHHTAWMLMCISQCFMRIRWILMQPKRKLI